MKYYCKQLLKNVPGQKCNLPFWNFLLGVLCLLSVALAGANRESVGAWRLLPLPMGSTSLRVRKSLPRKWAVSREPRKLKTISDDDDASGSEAAATGMAAILTQKRSLRSIMIGRCKERGFTAFGCNYQYLSHCFKLSGRELHHIWG